MNPPGGDSPSTTTFRSRKPKDIVVSIFESDYEAGLRKSSENSKFTGVELGQSRTVGASKVDNGNKLLEPRENDTNYRSGNGDGFYSQDCVDTNAGVTCAKRRAQSFDMGNSFNLRTQQSQGGGDDVPRKEVSKDGGSAGTETCYPDSVTASLSKWRFPRSVTPDGKSDSPRSGKKNIGAKIQTRSSADQAQVAPAPVESNTARPNSGVWCEGEAFRRRVSVEDDQSVRSGRFTTRSSFQDDQGQPLLSRAPSMLRATQYNNQAKSRFTEPPPPPPPPPDYQLKRGPQLDENSGQFRPSGQLRTPTGTNRTGGEMDVDEDDSFGNPDAAEIPDYEARWTWWRVLEWTALFLNLAALTCTRLIPQTKKTKFVGLLLWKWILLMLVIFCGRLFSGWVVRLLVLLLERSFLMRKRVLYFVYALRRGVRNCVWLALVYIAWSSMFTKKVDRGNHKLIYVSKVLECCLVSAVLFVVKVFLVKVLASMFHVGTYFERIRDAIFNQYVLETLSGSPVMENAQMRLVEESFVNEIALLQKAGACAPELTAVLMEESAASADKLKPPSSPAPGGSIPAPEIKSGSGIHVHHLHNLNRNNISAWKMKRLLNMVKHQRASMLSHNLYGDNKDLKEIRSEWQANSAARDIFQNVAKPGHTYIDEADLMRFMRDEEVIRALALFDGAMETGKITRRALKKWVVTVYQERRALALSLNDTKTAVKKLHRIMDVILLVTCLVIFSLVLGVANRSILVFLSSQVLVMIFIFGNTLKTTFEAIIFLFVMHPFDVGDRCLIDGVQYVVEEMNILTTVFLGDFNAKVWIPNSVLSTKTIQNFYRSPDMGDCFEFVVSASTPFEKIGLLKDRMCNYIMNKPEHWQPSCALNVSDMSVEFGKMKLVLGFGHTMNYQNYGEKMARKGQLILELRHHLDELGINYQHPLQQLAVNLTSDGSPDHGSSVRKSPLQHGLC